MNQLDNEFWDKKYIENIKSKKDIKYDNWLESFDKIINETDTKIIDLGCGSGNNALYLVEKNKQVIACDYSKVAIKNIKNYIPEATAILFDMTEKIPFEDNSTKLVIADLCLHYFSKDITEQIIREIKRILMPNGYLLFRVNSTNDTEYGAMQGEKLDNNFYFVYNRTKRFFDEQAIKKFFEDWEIKYIKEERMDRHSKPKNHWKCAVKVKK